MRRALPLLVVALAVGVVYQSRARERGGAAQPAASPPVDAAKEKRLEWFREAGVEGEEIE